MSPDTKFSFDQSPIPYQSLDANGKILHVNEAWLDTLGYAEKDVIGKPFSAFLVPDSARSFKGKFAQFKEKGWVHGVEFTMARVDGREITIQFDGNIEKDDNNQFKRTHCVFRDVTEHRKMEFSLRDSEQFLEDIFNAIQDGISVLDKDLTILRVNTFMKKMYAHQMPIVGKKCYQVYQGRKTICPWCPSRLVLEDGNQHTAIVPYPTEKDPTGWIELTSYPLLGSDGKITGVIEYVKDITERKLAEQALRESAEYQKTIFETTSLATIIIEEDTTISMVNNEFEKLSGCSKEELEGKVSWTEFVVVEDLKRMKEYHQQRRIDSETTPKQYEFRFINKKGSVRNVLLYVDLVPGTKKSVASLFDITERKLADEKLRQSEHNYRILADNTPLCIFTRDIDFVVTFCNETYARYHEKTRADIIGKSVYEIFPKDTADQYVQRDKQVIKAGERKKFEDNFLKAGKMVWEQMIETPITDSSGRISGVLGVFWDITERKQAEQDIKTLLDISRRASAETSLDDMLFFIANQIVKIIPSAEAASIFLYNEERKELEVQAWAGFSDNDIKGLKFNIDGSQAGKIFLTKKSALINNIHKDPDFKMLGKPSTDSVKSQIAVPLIFKKRVVGIMYADNLTRTDAFSQKNLDLLESIGNQLASVIENARLLENARQSEDQYHSVVEDSPGVISRFTPDGTIIFANQEYCRFFGKKYDELIGMNIQSVIPEEDRESIREYIVSFTQESPVKTIENKVIRYDGEIRWMRWADRALFDDDGQIISIQSFGEDITERKQAEQALKQEQEKAQKYLDIAEVIMLALNQKGEVTLINKKGNQILGYEKDELLGKNWFDTCVPERNRNEVKQVHRKNMSGETELVEYYENPVLTRSGEERIIAWRNTALWIWDEDKHIIGTLSSGEDITEQMRADERIKSLSKFPGENPNPVLRFSKEGKILYASKSSALLLNKWGRSVGENVPKDWEKDISSTFTSGENLEIETLCKGRTFSFILAPIKEMDYVNAYGRDITERVRAEQLMNVLNRASVAMGAALTQQDVFNAIARELKQLDISCMLFPIDETQSRLITKFISYEYAILKPLEKLVGLKYKKYSFPIDAVDMYQSVIKEKETLLEDTSEHTVRKMFPKLSKKIITLLVNISRGKKSISAPLIVKDQVIGVFSIQSDYLTREDVPAATAFADQLSSAWKKIGLLQDLRKTVEGTIHTIAATVETRDPYTASHQKRVADLVAVIAREMKLPDKQVEGIKMAGVIHDLGKIRIPAEILSKPGKLSDLEFNLIKTHPQVGFDLLKEIDFPWPIAEMILQHHEKMNGSGYPQGLKGDEIMIEARILAVADTVEAMSSHRPYRPALGLEKALAQIKQDKGTLFDPDVVDACLKIFKEGYQLPKA